MTNKRPGADKRPPARSARRPEPRYDLAQLVAGMGPEKAHPEVDWGEPRGEEAW